MNEVCDVKDLLSKEKKKIELLACLQEGEKGKDNYFYFSVYDLTLHRYESIIRCGKHKVNNQLLDVIICKVRHEERWETYLGNWNDGVV